MDAIKRTNERNKVISRAKEMVSIVQFAKEDPDHVLRRRFKRLHLYTLYDKHNRLIKLDEKLAELERAMRPPEMEATLQQRERDEIAEEALKQASELSPLINQIDTALNEFGMPLPPRAFVFFELIDDTDLASLRYQRSMEAPEPHTHYLEQLRGSSKLNAQHYCNHYGQGKGWSECTLHYATKKGVIHRCFDRVEFLKSLLAKVRPSSPSSSRECCAFDPANITQHPKEQRVIMKIYSESAVERLEDISINIIFCTLVIAPIAALSYLKDKFGKLIIVFIFVLLSAVVSSFLAKSVHNTSLAVIAA